MRPYIAIHMVQIVAFVLFMLQAFLARRHNNYHFFFGVGAILLFLWTFWHSRSYGEIGITLLFLILTIYHWYKGKGSSVPMIGYCSNREHTVSNLVLISCLFFFAYVFRQHTNAIVPYWYAMVLAFAFTGLWLMGKHKIEGWIFLNLSSLMAMPLFLYLGQYVFAVLTMVFLAITVAAYHKWRKVIRCHWQRYSGES